MKVLVLTPLHDDNKKRIEEAFPDFDFTYSSHSSVTQQLVDGTDIIIGNIGTHVNINSEHIQMLQLNSAGSDSYVKNNRLNPKTILANGSGVHSDAMAEHTIGMILATNKCFPQYILNMKEHLWHDESSYKEIYGSTVLIVGFGDIGYELARRLKPFNCHIIGIKRRPSEVPEYVDEIYTTEHLDELLPKADYIISCLPHTKDTIHLFNYDRFSMMKEDATFVNIGRGSAVDTQALKDVLDEGRLHSVCLDVLEQEPLDASDSLWDYPKVFITPHVAGGYARKSARDNFTQLVIRNIQHFLNGEKLENEVDFQTGYRKVVTYKD